MRIISFLALVWFLFAGVANAGDYIGKRGLAPSSVAPVPIHVAFSGVIATGSLVQFKLTSGATAVGFGCKCKGGSTCSLTAQLRKCDADGNGCAVTGGQVSPNANDSYFNDLTFTDPSYAPATVGEVFLSSVSVAPSQVFCHVDTNR